MKPALTILALILLSAVANAQAVLTKKSSINNSPTAYLCDVKQDANLKVSIVVVDRRATVEIADAKDRSLWLGYRFGRDVGAGNTHSWEQRLADPNGILTEMALIMFNDEDPTDIEYNLSITNYKTQKRILLSGVCKQPKNAPM